MNVIIDLILILVAGLTVFTYVRNGFVRSVISAGRFYVSFALACFFASSLGNALAGTGFYSWIENIVRSNIKNASESAVSATSDLACKAVAFILIFIFSNILIGVLGHFICKVFELPVLKQIDKVGGICLGIVCGVLNLFAVSAIIGLLINVGIIGGGEELAESTFLFKLISKIDVTSLLLNILRT